MPSENSRFLIVVADDFGYSERRDDGIVECFHHGAVTNTSVMVNGVTVKSGVAKALKAGLSMGLHLNLTEGNPVGSSSYKTLVGDDGLMLGMFGLREAVSQNKVDMNEVMMEIQQQINKFEKLTGSKPVSVDGHQHAHVVPGIREVFASVLKANGIRMTRLPVEDDVQSHTFITEERAEFMIQLVQQSKEAASIFTSHGIWFPGFCGLMTMGSDMTFEKLKNSILHAFHKAEADRLSSLGGAVDASVSNQGVICELMTHPGYMTGDVGGCGDGPDNFSQSDEREHEMHILLHEDMRQFYQGNNIKLIPFSNLP